MIAIVDYGAGNLRSIRRALEASGAIVTITSDRDVIAGSDAVVFPGVGAAAAAMTRLRELRLHDVIAAKVADGTPFLGICLGFQLLFGPQEEGNTAGLGLIPGRVHRLRGQVKVPHIGWNRAQIVRPGPLGQVGDERYYYFVHSYVVEPERSEAVMAITSYGEDFPSVVVDNNVWGTQFHPEKSGPDGLALVAAFVQTALLTSAPQVIPAMSR